MSHYQINPEGEQTVILQLTTLLDPTENQGILEKCIAQLDENRLFWVVDMSAMSFVNSTGLNFLISLLTRTRTRGGEVVLAGLSDRIKQVLVLTRLQTMFIACNSQAEALEFLSQSQKSS